MHQFYDWFGLNVALFRLVNGPHAPWWDRLMLAMTWLGDHGRYAYYMAALLLLATATARRKWMPWRAVVTFGVGYALMAFVVGVLRRNVVAPRPLLVLGKSVILVGPPEFHHSFPSSHAAFAVLLATALSRGTPRPLRWALWVYAGFVCIARISVGANFPADVVGGAVISLVVVGVASEIQRVLSKLPTARS